MPLKSDDKRRRSPIRWFKAMSTELASKSRVDLETAGLNTNLKLFLGITGKNRSPFREDTS